MVDFKTQHDLRPLAGIKYKKISISFQSCLQKSNSQNHISTKRPLTRKIPQSWQSLRTAWPQTASGIVFFPKKNSKN